VGRYPTLAARVVPNLAYDLLGLPLVWGGLCYHKLWCKISRHEAEMSLVTSKLDLFSPHSSSQKVHTVSNPFQIADDPLQHDVGFKLWIINQVDNRRLTLCYGYIVNRCQISSNVSSRGAVFSQSLEKEASVQ